MNWTKSVRLESKEHQVIGVNALVTNPVFALFDEMGAGKTKQVIDAAQILFHKGIIERVFVVAPAAVRSVWYDQDLGELAKHLWKGTPNRVIEYHARSRVWDHDVDQEAPYLTWLITNFDFIRQSHRLEPLLSLANAKTLLVVDESSAVKSYRAKQAKACNKLRKRCGRVVLLNGTPIANSPGDMFMQGHIMDPMILACQTWFHFRSRYAIMGGFRYKQVVAWINVEDIQKRFKPYVLRRLKKDCLDLPCKLDPVTLTVPLKPESWERYRKMRDDMVAWLEDNVSMPGQAVVKALRLSQLTSGFLGGLIDLDAGGEERTEETSREKLDFFLSWLTEQFNIDPNKKILVWCRFRPELQRMLAILKEMVGPNLTDVGCISGGQKRWEREHAIQLLDPRVSPDGPVVVLGNPKAGGLGLNLTAAHTVLYVSNDYNLMTRLQSMDRVHRPGQTYPVSYFDIVATGPQGQKTVDHSVAKALQRKENVATWTTAAWVAALKGEETDETVIGQL